MLCLGTAGTAGSCGADGGVTSGSEGVGGDVSEDDCNDSIRRWILPMCPGGTPRFSREVSNVLSSAPGMLRKSSTSSYPSSLSSAECLERTAPSSLEIGEELGAFGLRAWGAAPSSNPRSVKNYSQQKKCYTFSELHPLCSYMPMYTCMYMRLHKVRYSCTVQRPTDV